MKILYLIPARGGSKGIKNKNIKELNGKPLIYYTIDFARFFSNDEFICLSTDSEKIIECAKKNKLLVKFKRPSELATDSASTYEVIIHALNYYKSIGFDFDLVVLLQPTSPFRKASDLKRMIATWDSSYDMYVSVRESQDSPHFNLYAENKNGLLHRLNDLGVTRRQDSPKVYALNGSIYIYNVKSILDKKLSELKNIKKFVIKDPIYSIDIDNQFDWEIAEYFSKKVK